MSAGANDAPKKFFDQFTATKDRPKEFQMTVMVLVMFVVICAVVAFVTLLLES